jgi:hypothetical protein
MAAASPIWIILILAIACIPIVFGGRGAGHALRKLLVFVLTAGATLALLALVVYPFRQSHDNVYVPPEIEVSYEDACDYTNAAMQSIGSNGAFATMQFTEPTAQPGEPASWVKFLVIGAPALAALAALAALRRGSAGAVKHGSGLGWLAIGVATFVLLGFLFTGRTRQATQVVTGINTFPDPQLAAPDSANRAQIDQQWDRLTGPRIPLDPPAPVAPPKPAAQDDLQKAAETLQVASEKIAESASQGWLHTAVTALLNAQSKSSKTAETKAAATLQAQRAKAVAHAAAEAERALEAEAAASAVAAADPLASPLRTPAPGPFVRKLRAGKPDWVDNPPGIVGNVRKLVLFAGPYKTLEECHKELEIEMRSEVAQRVAELAAAAVGRSVPTPDLESLNIGTDYILRELCTEEYVEQVQASFGPMLRAYTLLELTPSQDAALLARWKSYARRDRLFFAVLGSGLAVSSLALAYGLLKVDTWTRGYYSKRLFLGVPAAIIGVVALLAMLS